MNPQMAPHQQAQYPNSQPQQPQNFNQQKQMPNAQQKGAQGHQQTHNQFGNFDPKITFWSLERPKNADSWADVKPQQQHIPIEELQDELEKFKRKDLTVKRVLDEVKSANCRKLINNLADDQTKELQNSNRALKFIIGGVLLEWRYIDRRKKEKALNRVQVILQTVPSGILETQFSKPVGVNGSVNGNAQGPKSSNQPGMSQGQQQHGNMQGQGPHMAQQPRNGPQPGMPHMGQSQFDARLPSGAQGQAFGAGGALPPPPPGVHQVPGHGGGPLPPPPPPGAGGNHAHFHPQTNGMPSGFQGSTPRTGMRPPQPYVETIDSRTKSSRKQRYGSHRGLSSDEDSNEWDTETGSSGSDSYRVRSVDGGFGLVDGGHRGRSKRSKDVKNMKNSKTSQRQKSRSRVRSRSVSKARQGQYTRRRGSDSSSFRRGHSPASSKTKSPYHSSSDEGRRGHKSHKNRARSSVSPTRAYNERVSEKYATSPTMSRRSSQRSWSDTTSSDHSGKHSRRDRGHGNTRSRSNSRHHHSRSSRSKYNNLDERYNVREPRADDYPYENTPFHESATYRDVQVPASRPSPPRRAATHVPFTNPFFANAALPAHQTRDSGYNTYAADLNAREYPMPSQPQRYPRGPSPVEQDRFAMNHIVDALYDRIAQNGEVQRTPPLGRHQAERRDGGYFEDQSAQRMPPLRRHQTERSVPVGIDDEWQRRYPSARGAAHGAYGRY
jgi:hypothetical protein